MGAYILCDSKPAKLPFYMKEADLQIYTIEELCFYLGRNLDLIDPSVFSAELCHWMSSELGRTDLALRLGRILEKEEYEQEFLLAILEDSDYCTKEDVAAVKRKLGELSGQPPHQRSRNRGDHLMEQERFRAALAEYELILEASQDTRLEPQFYADVWYNAGCAYGRLFQFDRASECLLESWRIDQSQAGLKAYIAALYLWKPKDAADALLEQNGLTGCGILKDEAGREIMNFKAAAAAPDLEKWCKNYKKSVN